jgi:PadR family transcriptional regulator, regulatory protein PadR
MCAADTTAAHRSPSRPGFAALRSPTPLAARGESPASHRGRRGALLTRRDDREYREYLREEQRSQRGCIAGRMQLEFHHGLLGPAHQISSASLHIRQGSLYPALHRLERRGWIKARWSTSANNRRAKYYELTRRGREELEAQTAAWHRLAATIGLVLETV